MRYLEPTCVVLLLGVGCSAPAPPVRETSEGVTAASGGVREVSQVEVTQELLGLEDVWGKAEVAKDGATVGQLLSEDFVNTAPDGTMIGKAQYIEQISTNKDEYVSAGDTDRVVRVYGNAAVVTGLWTQTVKTERGNVTSKYRWTCVWIRQADGRWLCVSNQAVLASS